MAGSSEPHGLGDHRGGAIYLVFLVACATWVISEIVGSTILPQIRSPGSHETSRRDRGSRLTIFLGVFGSIAAVYAFAGSGFAALPGFVVYAGLALMFAGVGLRQWAIAVLGRYFSTSVRAVAGHRIVTAGPYRLLRHPSYSGAIVTVLGIGFAGGSWEGIVTVLALALAAYGHRIHVEEKFLIAQSGEEYLAYRARTKRILPFVG